MVNITWFAGTRPVQLKDLQPHPVWEPKQMELLVTLHGWFFLRRHRRFDQRHQ
jgi:hypothetical protein